MARTHVYETHRTPSRRRSSSGTRFAVSHRRSRSPLVALLTPPSRACAVDVRLMQRKLFASNALGRPLAHAGAFARFVSQACPTKESRGCVRDQPLKPMIVVTERAPLTAPVCAAQRRACAGATVTASSAACVPLLVGTANPQATARRCALTVVPPRSQGLGLVIESDFYATDAGRAHFANQLTSIRYCVQEARSRPPARRPSLLAQSSRVLLSCTDLQLRRALCLFGERSTRSQTRIPLALNPTLCIADLRQLRLFVRQEQEPPCAALAPRLARPASPSAVLRAQARAATSARRCSTRS